MTAAFMAPPPSMQDDHKNEENIRLKSLDLTPMPNTESNTYPKSLQISEALSNDTLKWDDNFQSFFNANDPQNPIASAIDINRHNRNREPSSRLQCELGDK